MLPGGDTLHGHQPVTSPLHLRGAGWAWSPGEGPHLPPCLLCFLVPGKAGVGGPLPFDPLVEQAGQNSGRSPSLACCVGTPALGVFTLSYTTALPLPSENPQPHPSQVNTPFPDFELWCWRRLLRAPWTARRSNQSILREINPEYSQEALMLKSQLLNSGHLM